MSGRNTFIVEIDFDRPIESAEQGRYICASLEQGIELLWHDYMANEEMSPQIPKRVCVRWNGVIPAPQPVTRNE